MKVIHRKGLGFIVVFTTICSVVELLVRGIDLSRFKNVIYHLIGSGEVKDFHFLRVSQK